MLFFQILNDFLMWFTFITICQQLHNSKYSVFYVSWVSPGVIYLFCIVVIMTWRGKTPLLIPTSCLFPQSQCLSQRSSWQQCWASWLLSLYCLLQCSSTGSVHQPGSEYMLPMSLHTGHSLLSHNASEGTDGRTKHGQ